MGDFVLRQGVVVQEGVGKVEENDGEEVDEYTTHEICDEILEVLVYPYHR